VSTIQRVMADLRRRADGNRRASGAVRRMGW
jgi:hypothetical protein